MTPRNGLADWEVTIRLAKAMGFEMSYSHPSEIMDEIAALTPTFSGVSFAKLDELARAMALQREGARGDTGYAHRLASFAARASSSSPNMSQPTSVPVRAILCCWTTGRILSQYNVGRKRGEPTTSSGTRKTGSNFTPTTPNSAGSRDGDWVRLASRAGETTLRALITERVAPGVVYTTFHHPDTQANVITTEILRLGNELPGIQGHGGAGIALQPAFGMAKGL